MYLYGMDYWQYTLKNRSEDSEMIIALLADAPFDTFAEGETGVEAYLPAHADLNAAEMQLQSLQQQFPFTWHKTFIAGQNWNEIWESNFQPVIVRDFCAVRADFHAPIEGVQHELVINPKMAFGTGHHETTWMCLSALEALPIQGAHVFDYGCGTGILAIMAAKLGAAHIEAIDIETESYHNTVENSGLNGVAAVITARCGTLADVQGTDFDIILANINRNVLLDSMERLAQLIKHGGTLLLSGILQADEPVLVAAAKTAGFVHQHTEQRGNWLAMKYTQDSTYL